MYIYTSYPRKNNIQDQQQAYLLTIMNILCNEKVTKIYLECQFSKLSQFSISIVVTYDTLT